MWKLAETNTGFALRKDGQSWARLVGGIMSVLGAFFALVSVVSGLMGGDGFGYAVVWFIAVFLPGAILASTLGKTESRKLTAVTSRTDAIGGTVLALLGEGGLRHEVAVPADVADRVIASLQQHA
ncbi:hypothetical protein [Demequina capsici]|uniref:Uncharacterized protein n=1 Tax=Demequina capsici TaxID=3075620 RepID=A0AA96FAX5_9MICO|nr:hypothetical protein [Demequina sp. OYTSA14]WNM25286.1 hypothetical protein RN606_03825 [Demequina sp. OYTSA14]